MRRTIILAGFLLAACQVHDEEASFRGGQCHHDTDPPVVEVAELTLWPPNHKFVEIDVAEDCLESVIDCHPDNIAVVVDYVTSDEVVDTNGDGNTDPDIVIGDDGTVQLRAERQGGSNGRVYTIVFTVTDGVGNTTDAQCIVTVDHDQGPRGAAIDDGPAYRVDA